MTSQPAPTSHPADLRVPGVTQIGYASGLAGLASHQCFLLGRDNGDGRRVADRAISPQGIRW